ncbi:RNA methyltransferase [Ustulina deusta]|nr:RNA methyltransferase [Ustulina deusta]
MKLPTSSCLLGKHRVFLNPLNSQRLAVVPSQPASSLSAIHNGLRESQKARPQGFTQSSLETAGSRRPSQGPRRTRDPDWTPPTFKIKRGKKDVTDTGPERQSRRARFNDPTNNFGKRSLVYQMKHGELRGEAAELEARGRSSKPLSPWARSDRPPSAGFTRDRPRDFTKDRPRHFTRDRERDFTKDRESDFTKDRPRDFTRDRERDFTKDRPRDFTRDRSASAGRWTNSTRDVQTGRASPAYDRRPVERGSGTRTAWNARSLDNTRTTRTEASSPDNSHKEFTRATPLRTRHEFSSNNAAEQSSGYRNEDKPYARKERENWKADDGPIRIHHTTAASQFLYGRSVVKAALKASRRQLYKLYIYDGDDRENAMDDEVVAKLAGEKGVDVTRVPNSGLRMMDKMSAGRPHNGYVLEASPLPQPSLKSLGLLSQDPEGPGFHVYRNHQSREEQMVNGTSDFISYQLPEGRKPFVLLLDGILDPGNLGAILRTAGFLGINGIVITRDGSATLTPVALKASAGASEVMTLFSVNKVTDFLANSKENGWVVYAAVPATKRSRANSHLTVDRIENYDPLSSQPTVLVIGSEGEGLTKQVRRLADHEVSIPGASGSFSNVVDSLNVSVATGILCSAFLRKQSSGMMGIEQGGPSEAEDESQPQLW